jgi:DNA-binding response OmpR family regulator
MDQKRPVILIVEDDPSLTDLLVDVLETEGTIETVADGPLALARIEQGGIDLVLLDLMLPGLDGVEICQRVRARRSAIHLPIIMLTAMAADGAARRGFAAGADDYITKPFNTGDLLDRVGAWLRVRQAQVQQREAAERGWDLLDRQYATSLADTIDGLAHLLIADLSPVVETLMQVQTAPEVPAPLRQEATARAAALCTIIQHLRQFGRDARESPLPVGER